MQPHRIASRAERPGQRAALGHDQADPRHDRHGKRGPATPCCGST